LYYQALVCPERPGTLTFTSDIKSRFTYPAASVGYYSKGSIVGMAGIQTKILGLLLVCLWQICTAEEATPANELEKLFEAGHYQAFFKTAKQQAQQGNVDAQFLLGKAYHLGKGIDADSRLARHYYELAAKQNSARAEHNLGTMEMHSRPDLALEHFNRALELGLELPTYYNLGNVYKERCDQLQSEKWCDLAGDSFSQAWNIEHKNDALDDAIFAYTKACLIQRHLGRLYRSEPERAKTVATCKQATEWAEKGAELGLGRATYNRGAIELDSKRYAEALPWFRLAYEREVGLAAYTLGEMQENGQGLPKDEVAALEWFKRGAELKNEQAVKRMRSHWEREIHATFNPARIKAAMAELAKLEPSKEPAYEALYRLQLIEKIAKNSHKFHALAKQPIQARFCPEQDILYENTEWLIYAVSKPEQTVGFAGNLSLLAQGVADVEGCLTLTATALTKLQHALESGATPMINSPGRRRLLSVIHGPQGDLMLTTGLAVRY
jgi:TPR repeat protein